MNRRNVGGAALALLVLLAVTLAGCSTLNSALSMIQVGGTSSESSSDKTQTPSGDSQASTGAQEAPSPSRATMPGYSPYQMQFYAIYALAAPFGGYKAGEEGYRPGQGTVWELSGTRGSRDISTVEHALLKVNADGSQWWRVELKSGDESLLYEFLVSSNDDITKVRYKDPDSGQIVEFIPDPSAKNRAAGAGAPVPQSTDAGQGKVQQDRQTITVKAGTFRTDHAVYTDDQNIYRSEIWTSAEVPGRFVKFSTKNLKNGEISQGELVRIERGVTTVLQSY